MAKNMEMEQVKPHMFDMFDMFDMFYVYFSNHPVRMSIMLSNTYTSPSLQTGHTEKFPLKIRVTLRIKLNPQTIYYKSITHFRWNPLRKRISHVWRCSFFNS